MTSRFQCWDYCSLLTKGLSILQHQPFPVFCVAVSKHHTKKMSSSDEEKPRRPVRLPNDQSIQQTTELIISVSSRFGQSHNLRASKARQHQLQSPNLQRIRPKVIPKHYKTNQVHQEGTNTKAKDEKMMKGDITEVTKAIEITNTKMQTQDEPPHEHIGLDPAKGIDDAPLRLSNNRLETLTLQS